MHSSSDGVWHPDRFALALVWAGIPEGPRQSNAGFSKLGNFNAFRRPQGRAVVEAYTEQLAAADAQLQRYMDCAPAAEVDKARGNWAVAEPGTPRVSGAERRLAAGSVERSLGDQQWLAHCALCPST